MILLGKMKMKLMVLESAPLLLEMSGLKTTFHKKLEDFTGVSGVTIEYNNPQSVSEITINLGPTKKKSPATGINFRKNTSVNNELKALKL